MQLPAVDKRAS